MVEYFCLLFLGTQNYSFRLLLDYPRTQIQDLNFSQSQCSVMVLHIEPKHNNSIVSLAATIVGPSE